MKHILYVLLSALALFLTSCKKDKETAPDNLDGTWLQIGDAGVVLNWYPPSNDNRLQLEDNTYTRYYKNGTSSSGNFELFKTGEKELNIRFNGQNPTYTVTFQHDTLCIRAGELAEYYKKP